VRVVAVVREKRDADAGGDVHLVAVESYGPPQGFEDAPGRRCDLARVPGGVQQERQLIPFETCHVPAQAFVNTSRQRAQQPVAGDVAQRFINDFEAVDVEEHDRQRLPAFPRGGDGLTEPVVEEHAVRQARHLVVRHRVVQLLGARPDELFKVSFVTSLRFEQGAVFEAAAHGRLDLPEVEGLRHVVEGARAHRFDGALNVALAADHDDDGVGRLRLNQRDHLQAVEALHRDVAEDEVELPPLQEVERLLGRARLGALVLLTQEAAQQQPYLPLVFHDQDARLTAAHQHDSNFTSNELAQRSRESPSPCAPGRRT